MDKLKNSFFQAYFAMPVPRLVVRTDMPRYTIIAANNAFLAAKGALEQDLIDQSLFDLFYETGEVTPERTKLETALLNSLHSNAEINIEEFEISQFNNEADPIAWWQIELLPVAEGTELPSYIIVTTRDVTKHILNKQELKEVSYREQRLQEELAATNEELFVKNEALGSMVEDLRQAQEKLIVLNDELESRVNLRTSELSKTQHELLVQHGLLDTIVNTVPAGICVLKGPDMILETINKTLLELWNKDLRIIGLPLLEVIPEIKSQKFPEILKHVYQSGNAYSEFDAEARLVIDGIEQTFYRDYTYTPIKDGEGNTKSILALSIDVTERALARLREQQLLEQQSAINEELAASNEELAATNEELAVTNEELSESRDYLQHMIAKKESAEAKLSLAIEAAGMGSWHIDMATNSFQYNPQLAKLYGYEGKEPMTIDQAIGQITEDCQELMRKAVYKAIAETGVYDVSFTQRRFNDDVIIWLRMFGRVGQDETGQYNVFSGVVMDITEQKKDEQRKNDFIGMVSHELKTPLTSLNGYAQILRAKAIKNEDVFGISALTKVTDQVRKMTALINGFLNMSRLESGKIELKKSLFNLTELVREQIEEAQTLSEKHRFIFESSVSPDIFADRSKIASVVSNLISNAIKYSSSDQPVEIECQLHNDTVQISIRDHGMGIPTKDIPHLFERFYRVESEEMQLISGFGIGLYLSAEIIEHHGGKIWVESEKGKGSTFFFSLPLPVK